MVKLFRLRDKPIVEAIRAAEKRTSAEIRVALRRNLHDDPVESARRVFKMLKMHETERRNGVLVLIETDRRRITVFGDEGIYSAAGHDPFAGALKAVEASFAKGRFTEGVVTGVAAMGEVLAQHFPCDPETDKDELADEVDR